jgi:hypothetical protein
VEAFEPDAIHALLVGVMNANAKLDDILYILDGDDDEEEEEEADG